MPSPVDRRVALERALRAVAYAALAGALILSIRAASRQPTAERRVNAGDLPALLARHEIGPGPIVLVSDTALDPTGRGWLAATGARVRWGSSRLTPTAISIEPLGDPAGGYRVAVAAPTGSMVRLADSLGPVDSAVSSGGGVSFDIDAPAGALIGSVGAQQASERPGTPPILRRIVVFGRASWETRFVIAALEERGWALDARIAIGPEDEARQGAPGQLDTARVAAVVALDEAAARHAPQISRFVREGGGLVLGVEAAGIPALAQLRVGTSGQRLASSALEIDLAEPRRALHLSPITRLAANATTLERRGPLVALAAQRVGLGQVVQVGYHDTWRWRMTGPDGSVEAHRGWWSGLVRTVAYRPDEETFAGRSLRHDAPLARMTATFGPPDPDPAGRAPALPTPPMQLDWLLGVVAVAALLTEWASRRLRGAR